MFNQKKYNKEHKREIKEYKRQWYLDNQKRLLEKNRQWKKDNPKYMEQWRKDNQDRIKESNKQWRKDNHEKIKETKRLCNINNPKSKIECDKRYYQKNHKKIIEQHRGYYQKRYKIDTKFNLDERISSVMRIALKNQKNGWHWEKSVGYTLRDLIEHLKSTIPNGYIWQDYIDGKLQIDHIIPISVFNYSKLEHPDFKRCWALGNLRLLPAKENLKKGNKLNKSFQPSLAI